MVSVGNPDRYFFRGDPRFRVEVLDDDVLLVDVQTSVVHRVPGADIDLLLAGTTTLMSGHLPPGGADAIRLALTSGALNRRSLLVGGGALAASGIMATALPFAAAALSFSYLPPADGQNFSNTEYDASDGQAALSGNPPAGAWTATRLNTGFANSSGSPLSVQVLLHATSGTVYVGPEYDEFGEEVIVDESALLATGAGSGAYIVATVQLPPAPPAPVLERLYFSLRVGARGDRNGGTGYGGVAVGAYIWDGGNSVETTQWFAAAGAGGGDGAAAPGGRWGVDGSGANPGLRANGSTGGTGGNGDRRTGLRRDHRKRPARTWTYR